MEKNNTLLVPAINIMILSRSQNLIIYGCRESLVDGIRRLQM